MNKLKITLIISLLPCFLSAQNYLSKERENDIKTSGRYYWDESAEYDADSAFKYAFNALSDRIIEDAVNQSRKQEEALKAIETGAHFDNLQHAGKFHILAWIAKDSVFVTTQKPITKMSSPQQIKEETPAPPTAKTEPAPAQKTELNPVATGNPVLQELLACKNVRDVRRVATAKGLVRGSKINSSEGFSNPDKCIIAVFTSDGTLAALLDKGGSSRTDLLSGKIIQNPEQYYKENELWYLLQTK